MAEWRKSRFFFIINQAGFEKWIFHAKKKGIKDQNN